MNPSTSGWIKKYFSEQNIYQLFEVNTDVSICQRLREIGFSYGLIDTEALPPVYQNFKYTQEELSKICFLQLLAYIHFQNKPSDSPTQFIEDILSFYETIVPKKSNLFTSFFTEKNPYLRLEQMLTLRWKEHFFSQSKSNDSTLNMILFSIDALSYEAFLTQKIQPTIYDTYLIENLIEILLSFKEEKNLPNDQDIHLILFLKKIASTDNIPTDTIIVPSVFETNFILDFIICNSWNNETKTLTVPALDANQFKAIEPTQEQLNSAIASFQSFIEKQQLDYSFFRSTNLVNNIINNSTSYIEFLLTRNKKRLVKEIQNNTQLMKLLVDSTYRDLNKEERKMVKKQTIEVIKTIPSLAIFLLPGGTVLLPIILKFIPSLLPSSFNENTEETN
ncbi:MAG: LETM1 domain-containing protein [Flavobacteriaceae bacterium]|jgi:uncharacterized membrane-anchored protein YhcB (DUF1043 family)|nr:LETM1 domain-containing protein [Flavobacteriaceae bacterium]